MLKKYLDDLESRINVQEEEALFVQWADFTEGVFRGDIFTPRRKVSRPPGVIWPDISINAALDDFDGMLLQQYKLCSAALENADGGILCARANYGTSILPSLFGVELFIMDEMHNTLPTSKPLPGGIDAVKKLIDGGIPDIYGGYGRRVFEAGRQMAEIKKDYDKIGRFVHIYHPDLQGPMDICELLVGSEIFILMLDYPELIHELLNLVTQTYIAVMKEWQSIIPHNSTYAVHWGMLHKGCIMLRNDSSMNLSPTMYDEFVKPYDQRLFDEFGGGAIHFCGRGDHYIESMSGMTGIYAINMSQPEYNRMDVIFRNTLHKGIRIIGFPKNAAKQELAKGTDFRSCLHCI
jgi:hypothetical protein